MENQLVETIASIAERLTDRDASVTTLTRELGDPKEKYSGSGYYLAPRDGRFQSVWLGIRAENDREYLTDIEVSLHPHVQLTISDLDTAFGPHKTVPVNPDGSHYRIGYRLDRAEKPYTVAVFATLDGSPEDSNSRVEKVMIRRDSR